MRCQSAQILMTRRQHENLAPAESEALGRHLAACAEWLGPDRVLWASDYPHPEFHPEVVKEVREAIAPLPEDAQRKVLGDSAMAAYRLPL